MKIKFKNGSYLESIKSNDVKRSSRADRLNEFYLKYPDVFLENRVSKVFYSVNNERQKIIKKCTFK